MPLSRRRRPAFPGAGRPPAASPDRLGLAVALLAAAALAVPARAQTQGKAKIALHAGPHTAKSHLVCVTAQDGGREPTDLPAWALAGDGDLLTAYDLYLVAVNADSARGVAGIGCGISYDGRAGKGVDAFGWTLCADYNFTNEGENGQWPESGAADLILWNLPQGCQTHGVPGFPELGAEAVGGAFYVYAYGPDVFRIEPTAPRAYPTLSIVDCGNRVTELQYSAVGNAVFGEAAGAKGCNPMVEPCAPLPSCDLSTPVLDFGAVPIGTTAQLPILVGNSGPGTLRGWVAYSCFLDFAVTKGYGAYEVRPGERHEVVVRFTPFTTDTRSCLISVSSVCRPVLVEGHGVRADDARFTDPWTLESRPSERTQRIRFRRAVPAGATLAVFDVTGRRVRDLTGRLIGLPGAVDWDADGLPGGVYFYRLSGAGDAVTLKFILLR